MSGDNVDRSGFPTGVFWSLEDCPIPEGLNPSSIYENIKKALKKKGYDGSVSIKAYGDGDKDQFTDAQIELVQVHAGDKAAREYRMSWDILLWAMDNYKGANFLLILNPCPCDAQFIFTLGSLKARAYVVILAQPDKEVASESLLRALYSVWHSPNLLDEGNPVDLSGICVANFDDFNSAQDLEALGTVRLKIELQSRGLKCGGTLQDRAARLFLLKSTPLDKLPKKFLAKNTKDKIFGCAVFDRPVETNPIGYYGDDIAGSTAVYWDHGDIAIAMAFSPFAVRHNLIESLAIKNMIGFLQLYFYVEKVPIPDYSVEDYDIAKLFFVVDDAGAGGKSARVKIMIRDMLIWALDVHCFGRRGPANLMVVSNTISQEPEMISFLQALQKRNISVLLVRSDKMENFKEVDVGDISMENFDWLWESLLKPIDHTRLWKELEEEEAEPEEVSRVIQAEEEDFCVDDLLSHLMKLSKRGKTKRKLTHERKKRKGEGERV